MGKMGNLKGRKSLFSLEPSAGVFYLSAAFFILGLSTQFPLDFAKGVHFYIINDLFSYLAFMVALFLVLARVVEPGIGLLINLVEALRNLYASVIWTWIFVPGDPNAGNWIHEILLLTCLFAAVIGLSVNKYVAVVSAGIALVAQFGYIQLFQADIFARQQFMLTSLVMTGCLLVVYYYRGTLETLVADLRQAFDQTHELKERAEQLEIRNRPFVTFGQNTAGLVHDFRNDVNAMSIAIQTLNLRNQRGKPLDPQDLDRIARSLENLTHRIGMVRYVTEAGRVGPHELLDLRTVVESAAYPFRISPEIRGKVAIEINSIGQVVIQGNRLNYLQLFENIIRNSCEALIEHPPEPGTPAHIGVVLARYGQQIEMEFQDNGPGIPACRGCQRRSCLDCPSFAVGKTTKKYGSGIGMINVFRVVKAVEGRIRLECGDRGTLITVSVPDGAHGTVDFAAPGARSWIDAGPGPGPAPGYRRNQTPHP